MMLRNMDDFLIDRVFQPVSDRAARYVSCYGIAAFLLTGMLLILGGLKLYDRDWIGLLITSGWLPYDVCRAYRLDAAPSSDVLPICRIKDFWLRILFLVVLIALLPTFVLNWWTGDYIKLGHEIGWSIVVPAYYFMACRKNPPTPRRSTVSLWRPVEAGS